MLALVFNLHKKGKKMEMEILVPRELLFDNYLKKDIQKLFYPFYWFQHVLLSTKFKIRGNVINPKELKLNITMSIIWAIFFFINGVIFLRYDSNLSEVRQLQSWGTQYILIYFNFICDGFCGVIVFILNDEYVNVDRKYILLLYGIVPLLLQ